MNIAEKKEYTNLRRKFSRTNESEEAIIKRKESNAQRSSRSRANESEDSAKARKEKVAKANSETRSKETEDEAKKRKDNKAKTNAKTRANETEDEAKARKGNVAKANAETRANETEEQSKRRKEKDATAKDKSRKMPKNKYAARNAQKVLYGEQIVPELKNSDDKIGSMKNYNCQHCRAFKWKTETSTLCCKNGKVSIPSFPDPPEYLKRLWTSDTAEARIFREHARPFNNALALSSVKVVHRKFANGFAPNVVFEGKVSQMYGPLQAEEGEVPRFAQLYVHDPATQQVARYKNMHLPTNLTKKQTLTISHILKDLQELLIDVNPFVKDYIHVCEIPDEDIIEGKLVISCKAPKDAHERRYNLQQSFSEVSVLTNSEPNDIVLRKRRGGLQFMYDD